MSDAPYEIDYDAETVFFENAWHSRADLAQQIRAMIDRGDYRVARPSAALEALESGLSGARVLAVRVAPELADAVEEKAGREGRSVAAVIRDALQASLRQAGKAPSSPPPRKGPSLGDVPSAGPVNTVAAFLDEAPAEPTGFSAGPSGSSPRVSGSSSRVAGSSPSASGSSPSVPRSAPSLSRSSRPVSGSAPDMLGSAPGMSGSSHGQSGLGTTPGPSGLGSSAGPTGYSPGPYGFTPGPGDIMASAGGASARPARISGGPSGFSAESISAGLASISAGPIGVSAGPANDARARAERAAGVPPLAQVAERLAEAVLAEADGAPHSDPRSDETWFGR